MNSRCVKGIIAGSFLLACVLTGCDSVKNKSISFNAVSIDAASVSSQSISQNDVEQDTVSENDVILDEQLGTSAVDTEYTDISKAKPGDVVVFGSYEQDGDDGDGLEPIEWVVLDEYEDTILVFSKYVIDKKPFNENDTAVYWSQSTIRKWLNDEFIAQAFSEKEQEAIVASVLNNPGSSGYFSEFSKNGGTATGNNTEDKVFLLSYADVLKYYELEKVEKYYIFAGADLITTATAACDIENTSMSQMEYDTFYKEEGWPEDCVGVEGSGWFLRSHGFNSDDVMSVGYDGGVRGYYFTLGADYESVAFEGGIRPAMWIYR